MPAQVQNFRLPAPLRPGDTIAITSPASRINPDFVEGCRRRLEERGYRVVVQPHTLNVSGSFSGTAEERLSDMTQALLNPEVKAVICSRGGYGAVHLLEHLDPILAAMPEPKWLVGFSDISALHALWGKHGIVSLHAAMTKHLAMGPQFPYFDEELAILEGTFPEYTFPSHPLNTPGTASGTIVGGNLAVTAALLGTPYTTIRPDTLLLIEDIAEPIYKVERQLYQLKLAGILQHLAGILVGQFTDYKPSADHPDMETMIHSLTSTLGIPVAFGLPFGHIPANRPLPLNHPATLTITPTSATLTLR